MLSKQPADPHLTVNARDSVDAQLYKQDHVPHRFLPGHGFSPSRTLSLLCKTSPIEQAVTVLVYHNKPRAYAL